MLTTLLKRRVSIENPSVPLTASNIVEFLGLSNQAASGVSVTRKTVLGLSAVWRAVNFIADSVATSPIHVYRRLGAGGKERAVDHPAYQQLRHRPHPDLSAFVFKRTMMLHALIEGGAFAYIDRRRPLQMTILDPIDTFPAREDGRLIYVTKWTQPDGRKLQRKMWAENVLHIRGMAWDGLTAYRLLDVLRDAFGLPLAAQRYGGRFFANDARPGCVIEVPYRFQNQAEVDAFRARWRDIHEGVDNVSRPAILENGGKVTLLGGNNEQAQFLQTRQFEVRQLAAVFGLPPHMLGDDTRTSYGSLEQENKSVLRDCINPWLVQWEAELREKLLAEREKESDSHTISFERKAFDAIDRTAQSGWYQMALQNRVMTPNEVREIEGMNPTSWGDEPLPMPNESPSAQPAESTGEASRSDEERKQGAHAEAQSEQRKNLKDAHVALIQGTLDDNLRRAAHQIRQASKTPAGFLKWLDEDLHAKNFEVFVSQLRPAVRAFDLLERGSTETETARGVGDALDKIRAELLEISGRADAEHLPVAADAYCETLLAHCPQWILGRIRPSTN